MQIFILDEDMNQNAKYYCDKHMKIILEATQILCTVVNESAGKKITPYKSTHKKHPITVWASESLANWKWIRSFIQALNEENRFRYGKDHKSALVARELPEPSIPDIGLTPFPQAFSNIYKGKDIVKAYRKYYICEKKHFAKWKNRPVPFFMK